MFYISMIILGWLAIGFVAGFKIVFFDKIYKDKEYVELAKNLIKEKPQHKQFEHLLTNKSALLSMFTLLGVLTFYLDTRKTFRRKKPIE